MLRVSVSQAQPGMVLAMQVPHPSRPDAVLLRAGAELDAFCIPRLFELGVREVWIRYPGMEALVRFVSPALQQAYRELTHCMGAALDSAMLQSRADLDYTSYRRAVMSVVDELTACPQAALFVTEIVGGDRPFVRHSGNVCALSLLMGLKLDFYLVRERSRINGHMAKDLSGLGVGAMLHDVGLTRLSDRALDHWNATRDESDPEWRSHARLGYELVKDNLDASACAVVQHHHQRYDGSGFPRVPTINGEKSLARSDIHVFARIAGCADLFDRLRFPAHAPRATDAQSPPIPAVRALRWLLDEPHRSRLDPIVFRALLAVAPPFPPGSVVTLSDGRHAAVVDLNPGDPCRPVVEVIDELRRVSAWKERARERIDLKNAPDVSIARFDGHDVSADIFVPSYPGELELSRLARSMGVFGDSAAEQSAA